MLKSNILLWEKKILKIKYPSEILGLEEQNVGI